MQGASAQCFSATWCQVQVFSANSRFKYSSATVVQVQVQVFKCKVQLLTLRGRKDLRRKCSPCYCGNILVINHDLKVQYLTVNYLKEI